MMRLIRSAALAVAVATLPGCAAFVTVLDVVDALPGPQEPPRTEYACHAREADGWRWEERVVIERDQEPRVVGECVRR